MQQPIHILARGVYATTPFHEPHQHSYTINKI